MFLWFFDPQRRSGAIGDLTNPVMAKEFRSRSFGRSHWVMRMVSACLIISLGLALIAAATQGGMGSVGSRQWVSADFLGAVLVLFQMGLVILVAPALSTALISSELEAGSWQLLQMTRLRPMQIVVGKLLSALWSLVLLLVATIPGYAVLLLIREEYTTRVWQVLVVLALTSLFAVLLGAMCSSLFRRTTAATTAAYVLIVALCVATLLPWLGEGTLFGRDVVATALKVNPVAAALSIIQMPGLADYQLVPFIWQFLAGASLFCAIVLWIRTWQLTRPS
jgi:ABC-type transport system involved in multi-copper enzyme maturation permease subunit